MRYDGEDDDWTPRLHSKLFFRAEAEAVWLQGSALGHGREQRIREAAYFNAERRGFAPGHEIDDWLAAEAALTP
jgi:hypothetical protein